MKKRSFLLSVLTMLPLSAAGADAKPVGYADSYFAIDLPPAYIGPVEHVSGTAVSRGFRKPYPGTPLNTVILVTVQEMGPTFARRVPAERMVLTRETLDPIVAGIESNRTGFRRSEPGSVSIAGYPGLKLAWSGTAQGIAFDGIVYCVLAGSRAYAVQIQDPAGRGKERMAEAVAAVERMRIAN
jgi:hypothetical protein